ncbi:four-carbon acid sugar kinase family protein [Candidatus Solirubrobacter pratensis]|uniref:four-carbon acid sugar kinase family protein n=1 Tax=Candidatus Solirubrobacter pratensis TaxID=1298857 RepID=UPI0003F90A7A|nr:four-carbon acid sugar kinase family protein [Candidatus Solirubrobacter pratensis]
MPGRARPAVAIVADDLTGACDAAVGFVRAGFSAHVVLAGDPDPALETDVIAVDAGTRHRDPGEAGRLVGARVRALRDAPLLIKKLDSTLRGNVAAELTAALAASGRRAAIVAPAFPRYGRTTAGGVQRLDGVPVHEGFAGEDPVSPARTSDLLALLSPATLLAAGERLDPERLAGVVVADASTDDDLDALVRAAPEDVLWAGSTGLTQAFGRVLRGPGARRGPAREAHRVVVAVGSLNPLARRQLARLREAGDPRVTILASPDFHADPAGVARELGAAVRAEVDAGADGVVLTGGDTAAAAIRALDATAFSVLGEVEPGIPLGVLRGGRDLLAVTKAGGFGSDEALTASVNVLLGSAP